METGLTRQLTELKVKLRAAEEALDKANLAYDKERALLQQKLQFASSESTGLQNTVD